MVDLIELLAYGVIGFLSGSLVMVYALFQLKKSSFFENILLNVLQEVANSEELKQNLYLIGGLLGQGFKGGFGIEIPTKNRGGKFKLQDLAMDLVGQFIQKSMSNPSSSLPEPYPLPPGVQPTPLKGSKLSDKW